MITVMDSLHMSSMSDNKAEQATIENFHKFLSVYTARLHAESQEQPQLPREEIDSSFRIVIWKNKGMSRSLTLL